MHFSVYLALLGLLLTWCGTRACPTEGLGYPRLPPTHTVPDNQNVYWAFQVPKNQTQVTVWLYPSPDASIGGGVPDGVSFERTWTYTCTFIPLAYDVNKETAYQIGHNTFNFTYIHTGWYLPATCYIPMFEASVPNTGLWALGVYTPRRQSQDGSPEGPPMCVEIAGETGNGYTQENLDREGLVGIVTRLELNQSLASGADYAGYPTKFRFTYPIRSSPPEEPVNAADAALDYVKKASTNVVILTSMSFIILLLGVIGIGVCVGRRSCKARNEKAYSTLKPSAPGEFELPHLGVISTSGRVSGSTGGGGAVQAATAPFMDTPTPSSSDSSDEDPELSQMPGHAVSN